MKILFITLSNLGDVILSLPLLDVLIEQYPDSEIKCICGPRPYQFLKSILNIREVVAYTSIRTFGQLRYFVRPLREDFFEVVVDLKNSLIPFFLRGHLKTPLFLNIPKNIHSRERFLKILEKTLKKNLEFTSRKIEFSVLPSRKVFLEGLLLKENPHNKKVVFLGIGARSTMKIYPPRSFSFVIERLWKEDFFPAIVGDQNDRILAQEIRKNTSAAFLDLCGKVSLEELAFLLEKFAFASISCDSAFLHLSSYMDIPTLGIFGPTSSLRYGPWSSVNKVVYHKDLSCRPCQKAHCPYNLECLRDLSPQQVLNAFFHMQQNCS